MKIDSSLYKLVYEYYETRILYGFYREGDQLPSIPKICAVFNMAPATIRTALALLEKNKYIKIDARKAAQVIYKIQPTQFRENAARYFVPREQGILDLSRAGGILFEPLWEEGLRSWSEEDWATLRKGMTRPQPDAVSMPLKFYFLTLGSLHNGLILNLYWEAIRYMRFPYLKKEQRLISQNPHAQSKEEIISFLKQEFEKAYEQTTRKLFAFIEEARVEYSLENMEPVPFEWVIYRQRPQLRYTLASRLIREIVGGRYPVGGYLPTLPQMAEQYGVALHTVRRTLEILSSLGVTRSLHGKGTIVCMEHFQIDYAKPEIREGLRLYEESLNLLALTVRPVSFHTLQSVEKEKLEALTRAFSRLRKERKGYLCIEVCLTFIERESPFALIRECYKKIRELLAWGYPIALLRIKKHGLHGEYAAFLQKEEKNLLLGDYATFAETWKALMDIEQQRFHAFVQQDQKKENHHIP